ncbi:MAG: hypothetical protein FD133_1317 [Erysipelotrichaceae bacterium]|nr:MAG: hypothetical protein FD133_1317 [Erysipelotrichaceae bacterium]
MEDKRYNLNEQGDMIMKAIKVFLIGFAVWFVSVFITGWIMPIPEVMGGSIVFMGINYLCYTLVKLSENQK